MLKARVEQVTRNATDPQVDLVVIYFDEDKKFQTKRVFTLPVDDELNNDKVNAVIQASGKKLKDGLADTIQKEDSLRTEFQGKEFDIV